MNSHEKITPFKADSISFIEKRLAEMDISKAEAERRAGVPKDTIVKLTKGAGTDYENYVAVMNLLRYSVPLYGKLISGVGVENILENNQVIQVPLPEMIEYSSNLLAIKVDDDRYEPRYFKGTYLYFKETIFADPLNLESKHPYVVKMKNQKTDVVIIREGSVPNRFTLVAIDGSAKITPDAELEWCAPIEGVRWDY